MSKAFTKIGKEIAMAVKASGPDPNNNPRLRAAMQNAKSLNMPKDRVEAAIKRASSKDESNFDEITYEGYAPHGVALLIECATDNANRTVANLRMHLSRGGGALGTTGSVAFNFEHKGFFRIEDTGINMDEFELELIDFGGEEVEKGEDGIHIYTDFTDYGKMQKFLEEKNAVILESNKPWIAMNVIELEGDAEQEVLNLIDTLEEDDDVQNVWHSLK